MLYGNPFGAVMMRCVKAGDIDGMRKVSKYIYCIATIDFIKLTLKLFGWTEKSASFCSIE